MANLILNQGSDGQHQMDVYMNQYKYDATKHWKSFLQSLSNFEWSLKNISVFIDNIIFENIENIRCNKSTSAAHHQNAWPVYPTFLPT